MASNAGAWQWSEIHQDHFMASYDNYRRPVYIWFKQTQGSQQQATHTGAYQVQRTQSYPPSTGYQHVQTVPQPSVPQTSPGPGTQLGAELNTETGPEQITQALSCLSVAESAGAESNTQAGAEQNTQTDADQNTQTDAHQDTQTGAQQTPLSQPYHITITGQQPSQLHRYQSYGQTGAQQDIYRSVQQNVPTGIQHTPLGQPYQSSYTGQQASNTHGYQPQVQAVHPSQSHYQNQVPGYQTYGQAAQTYQGPQGRPGHQPPQQAFHLQTYVPLRNDTQHGNADHHDHQHANHRDSGSFAAVPDSNVAAMPEPVPAHIRQRLPALVPGTPQQGWYEHLDPSYRMRTGREAHEFFQIGRVFSVLWAEAASETAARQAARQAGHIEDGTVRGFRKPDYTTGRFGEIVYSNIRRFVVMQVKRKSHFVYACPITTYSGRATTKSGCNPSEHTVVYFAGTAPQYVKHEKGNGMTKEPIQIEPTDPNDKMDPASRLRFGKTFPVEWNVKVKDIGKVNSHHLSKLVRYWKEEESYDSEEEEGPPGTYEV